MVNIMVVEDEKPISNLIALSLKKAGYHSECAYDGLEAIDMLEKNYPDLILLDIMLPGADGFEIRIRKTIRDTSHFPDSKRRS